MPAGNWETMGEIAIDLALSWFPAQAATTWSEPTSTHVRIATRTPNNGTWGIPFDLAIYGKSEKKSTEIAPGSRTALGDLGTTGMRGMSGPKVTILSPIGR